MGNWICLHINGTLAKFAPGSRSYPLLSHNNSEAVMEDVKKSARKDRHGFQVNYLAAALKLDRLMAESGLAVGSLAGSVELAGWDFILCPVGGQTGLQK